MAENQEFLCDQSCFFFPCFWTPEEIFKSGVWLILVLFWSHDVKGPEKMTIQEANILLAWRAQAMRDLTIGFGGGSIITFLATQRLRNLFRVNLSLGSGAVCGFWNFSRSMQSCIDHILSLEGSRMQRELANIMLKNYSNHPWVLQRHSKHFYSEEVYEDSSVDKPKFRWHFRNFSGDPIAHSQTASYDEETDSDKKDVKKPTVEPKQVDANAAGDAAENPFDLIFGLPESAENIPHPDTSGTSTREHSHRERRSRRRHRRHHREDSNA